MSKKRKKSTRRFSKKQATRSIHQSSSVPSTSAPSTLSRADERTTKTVGRGCSIAGVTLLLLLLITVALGTLRLLTVLANGSVSARPLSAGAAHGLLVEHQQRATEQLNGYGWVDQEARIAKVPITRAITLLAASTLPVGRSTDVQALNIKAGNAADTANETGDVSALGTTITPATVSFADHILPIFVEKCGKCHGDDDPDEGLVLTSYKDVLLGSYYGSVIKSNDVEGSYLVELVVEGQMPKRSDDLLANEIAAIIAWVEAGAPDN